MALQWSQVPVPFVGGLDTRTDPKAVQAPDLGVCENVVFATPGQIRKRNGYQLALNGSYTTVQNAFPTVAITTARSLATRGDELVLCDRENLYSASSGAASGFWNQRLDGRSSNTSWGNGCTSAGVSMRSPPKIRQDMVQADRATAAGITAYVWVDLSSGVVGDLWFSAVDSAGGTVCPPSKLATGAGSPITRPHIVAVGTAFMIFWTTAGGGNLKVITVSADSLSSSFPAPVANPVTVTVAADVNAAVPVYDVVAAGGRVLVAYNSATATTVKWGYVEPSGAVGAFTSQATAAAVTVVGVAVDAANAYRALLVWGMTANNHLDGVSFDAAGGAVFASTTLATGVASFANVTAVASAMGAPYPNGTSGPSWGVFWEVPGASSYLAQSWFQRVSSAGAVVTAAGAALMRHAGLASKPFTMGPHAYVTLCQESTLQTTYFVVRADDYLGAGANTIVARLLPGVAGGLTTVTGCLPQAEALSATTVGLVVLQRNRVGLAATSFDRGLKDVTLDFTAAAYPRVDVGGVLHLGTGVLYEYDGSAVCEHSFLLFPENVTLTPAAGGALTALATYSYRFYFEYLNAQGQRERSTAVAMNVTLTGANQSVNAVIPTLAATSKRLVAIVGYRSAANPGTTPIYYRVSNPSPSVGGTNGYIANSPGADTLSFTDQMSDATLITQETDYLSASELDHVALPACVALASSKNRVWAALAEDQDVIWPSLLRLSTLDPVSFSDALTVRLPSGPGPVTGLAVMNDVLIVFRDQRIYVVGGDAPDNTGNSQTVVDPRTISDDLGCMSGQGQSIVRIPTGLMFKSRKGIYLLSASDLSLSYVGAKVEGSNGEVITSAVPLADVHQVRFGCASGVTLVYDYVAQQWSKFTGVGGLDATLWRNQYTYLKTSAGDAYKEVAGRFQDSDSAGNSLGYSMAVETAWIRIAGTQGYQLVREASFLGDWKSAHTPRIRMAFDYEPGWVIDRSPDISSVVQAEKYGDDATYGATTYGGTVAGSGLLATSVYQFTVFARRRCQAVKLRFEDTKRLDPSGVVDYPWLESCRLNEVAFRIGVLPGLARVGSDRST